MDNVSLYVITAIEKRTRVTPITEFIFGTSRKGKYANILAERSSRRGRVQFQTALVFLSEEIYNVCPNAVGIKPIAIKIE